jgi:hypothetical protein
MHCGSTAAAKPIRRTDGIAAICLLKGFNGMQTYFRSKVKQKLQETASA